MIDPAGIPQITGDTDALAGHASTITAVGSDFTDTGQRVDSTWQGLAAVYRAPEASQLFAATAPVRTVSASVGEDLAAVGAALATYATTVAGIKTRLEALRADAAAFVGSVSGDDDWRSDEGRVNEHNQLISDVNLAVADFTDAQRTCANAILALYTDRRWSAEDGDGEVGENEFGYSAEMLDAAMGEDDALPWGSAEEHDRGFFGDVGAFFGGIGQGFSDMVTGLGALIGYAEGEWSWSTAGTAWAGLGTFAGALVIYTMPAGIVLDQTTGLFGQERGFFGDTLLTAGKAIIAYDTWGEDPQRAAGMTVFNVVSAVVGTKGAGAGLRGAGAAAQGSRFATVVRVGNGFTRAGEFLGRIPTVDDLVTSLRNRFPSMQVPHVDVPDVDAPTGSVDLPRVDLPEPARVDLPEGPSVDDAVRAADDASTPDVTREVDVDRPGDADAPPHLDPPDTAPETTPDPSGDRSVDAPEYIDPADVPAPLQRTELLPTRELDPHYRGENDPTNPARIFYPQTVEYMTPARLEEHRVVVVEGRLYWADDGTRLDTSSASTAHSGGGRAMFVMDEHGNLYVSLEQIVGRLHHSSFLGGRPVAGAGELVVVDGVPVVVSRKSGHYRPLEEHQEAVRDVLVEQGVDVSSVTFESGF